MQSEFELLFSRSINLDTIKDNLSNGLTSLLEHGNIEDEARHFNDSGRYHVEFDCIKIYLFNSSKRPPYFNARLEIRDNKTQITKAWYEQEYSFDGEILDDFFDYIK